jgi:nicotinate-nucleotide pyrophosphorylase (carboxylating)
VQKINQKYINNLVLKALEEDLKPNGDITTKLLNSKNKIVQAKIISKQSGIISGINFCKAAFKLLERKSKFLQRIKDGKKVKRNQIIAEITAKTKTILIAERTALNFLNHASGISTITNQYVSKVKNKTKICCTRKTTPNLRLLEKYAVRKGGGYNHRYNLSDEVLIKENHFKSETSLRNIIKKSLKTKKKVTVEIENLRQLNNVLGLKFNRILFDNVSLAQLKKYLKICKGKYETEYSGNANLKNITKISNTGVNRISVGSITHSAKSFDSSLLIF